VDDVRGSEERLSLSWRGLHCLVDGKREQDEQA
jgi:hypothetical protein